MESSARFTTDWPIAPTERVDTRATVRVRHRRGMAFGEARWITGPRLLVVVHTELEVGETIEVSLDLETYGTALLRGAVSRQVAIAASETPRYILIIQEMAEADAPRFGSWLTQQRSGGVVADTSTITSLSGFTSRSGHATEIERQNALARIARRGHGQGNSDPFGLRTDSTPGPDRRSAMRDALREASSKSGPAARRAETPSAPRRDGAEPSSFGPEPSPSIREDARAAGRGTRAVGAEGEDEPKPRGSGVPVPPAEISPRPAPLRADNTATVGGAVDPEAARRVLGTNPGAEAAKRLGGGRAPEIGPDAPRRSPTPSRWQSAGGPVVPDAPSLDAMADWGSLMPSPEPASFTTGASTGRAARPSHLGLDPLGIRDDLRPGPRRPPPTIDSEAGGQNPSTTLGYLDDAYPDPEAEYLERLRRGPPRAPPPTVDSDVPPSSGRPLTPNPAISAAGPAAGARPWVRRPSLGAPPATIDSELAPPFERDTGAESDLGGSQLAQRAGREPMRPPPPTLDADAVPALDDLGDAAFADEQRELDFAQQMPSTPGHDWARLSKSSVPAHTVDLVPPGDDAQPSSEGPDIEIEDEDDDAQGAGFALLDQEEAAPPVDVFFAAAGARDSATNRGWDNPAVAPDADSRGRFGVETQTSATRSADTGAGASSEETRTGEALRARAPGLDATLDELSPTTIALFFTESQEELLSSRSRRGMRRGGRSRGPTPSGSGGEASLSSEVSREALSEEHSASSELARLKRDQTNRLVESARPPAEAEDEFFTWVGTGSSASAPGWSGKPARKDGNPWDPPEGAVTVGSLAAPVSAAPAPATSAWESTPGAASGRSTEPADAAASIGDPDDPFSWAPPEENSSTGFSWGEPAVAAPASASGPRTPAPPQPPAPSTPLKAVEVEAISPPSSDTLGPWDGESAEPGAADVAWPAPAAAAPDRGSAPTDRGVPESSNNAADDGFFADPYAAPPAAPLGPSRNPAADGAPPGSSDRFALGNERRSDRGVPSRANDGNRKPSHNDHPLSADAPPGFTLLEARGEAHFRPDEPATRNVHAAAFLEDAAPKATPPHPSPERRRAEALDPFADFMREHDGDAPAPPSPAGRATPRLERPPPTIPDESLEFQLRSVEEPGPPPPLPQPSWTGDGTSLVVVWTEPEAFRRDVIQQLLNYVLVLPHRNRVPPKGSVEIVLSYGGREFRCPATTMFQAATNTTYRLLLEATQHRDLAKLAR